MTELQIINKYNQGYKHKNYGYKSYELMEINAGLEDVNLEGTYINIIGNIIKDMQNHQDENEILDEILEDTGKLGAYIYDVIRKGDEE